LILDGSSAFDSHPALEHDLEHAVLLPEPEHRAAHLARERRRVRAVLAAGGFAVDRGGSLALVLPLSWDTAHFGIPCADLARLYAPSGRPAGAERAIVEETVAECRARGVALLSARLGMDDLEGGEALLGLGALPVDTSVELGARLPLPPGPAAAPGLVLRRPRPEDDAALVGVAATFTDNRFHRDPRIPRDLARGVYERWVLAASRGEHGALLVAEDEDGLAGFATLAPPDDELGVGVIGLVAVHPRARGRRVLAGLVSGCVRALPPDARAVVTSTQSTNRGALAGFGRCGLGAVGSRLVFHLHLQGPDAGQARSTSAEWGVSSTPSHGKNPVENVRPAPPRGRRP
jgi:hypothetical protein